MASQEKINDLSDLMGEITEIDISDLIYNPNWGSINFEKAKVD